MNKIPQRFYAVFEEVGAKMVGYRPGTRWCNLCNQTEDEEFKDHRVHVSAARAKKVSRIKFPQTLMSALCLLLISNRTSE